MQYQDRDGHKGYESGESSPLERTVSQNGQAGVTEAAIVPPPQLHVLLLRETVPSTVVRFQRVELSLAPLDLGNSAAQASEWPQSNDIDAEQERQADRCQQNVYGVHLDMLPASCPSRLSASVKGCRMPASRRDDLEMAQV
jgi:hypothetical protein